MVFGVCLVYKGTKAKVLNKYSKTNKTLKKAKQSPQITQKTKEQKHISVLFIYLFAVGLSFVKTISLLLSTLAIVELFAENSFENS